MRAIATFEITAWDETAYDETADGPKLSRATVRKIFRAILPAYELQALIVDG